MPLLGQASGGWTESSSALRILHVGVRNTVGLLTDDSFTQANPVDDRSAAAGVTGQIDVTATGVLSGSVAFTRPDAGSNFLGGPGTAVQKAAWAGGLQETGYQAIGVFINAANGNAFENTPGTASGKGPYVSGQGTYGNSVYEEDVQITIVDVAGVAITYRTGFRLMSSTNGFLYPMEYQDTAAGLATLIYNIAAAHSAEQAVRAALFAVDPGQAVTHIASLKMPPDAVQNELVYDQRI